MIHALRPAAGPDLPLVHPTASTDVQAAEASGFLSVLGQIAGDAANAVKGAESIAMDGLQGNAPVQQVVDALMNAERNLQLATTIRDKVVGAYQEFSRMAI